MAETKGVYDAAVAGAAECRARRDAAQADLDRVVAERDAYATRVAAFKAELREVIGE